MGALLDAAKAAVAGTVVRRVVATLTLSAAGVAGIVSHEASVPVVYQDVVGINTVCVGHVTKAALGTQFTDDECAALLQADTESAQGAVRRGVKVPVSQDQFDAMVDFTFNVGNGAFLSSTLLRKLNAGDCHGAATEFLRWNKAQGRVLRGLTVRREHERAQFEKDCP